MNESTHDFGALEGHPAHDALFDESQQHPQDCEEAVIADVVNEVTGTHLTDDSIVDEAAHTPSPTADHDPTTGAPPPIYDPSAGGTLLTDAPALLAANGVHAVYTNDELAQQGGPAAGMHALENQVIAGHHVLASVDGPKIWDAIGVPHAQGDPSAVDHVVEVTGIDTTTKMVYLNDPGQPHGAGETVPLHVFEQAWALGGHAMVSTDIDHAATNPDPLAVPRPIPPTPATDPFAPFDNHAPDLLDPTHHQIANDRRLGNDLDTALLVAGVGAAGVAALSSRESRAAAVANTAALINRARAAAATGATTAAAQATAAGDRARTWIDQHRPARTGEQPGPTPE